MIFNSGIQLLQEDSRPNLTTRQMSEHAYVCHEDCETKPCYDVVMDARIWMVLFLQQEIHLSNFIPNILWSLRPWKWLALKVDWYRVVGY